MISLKDLTIDEIKNMVFMDYFFGSQSYKHDSSILNDISSYGKCGIIPEDLEGTIYFDEGYNVVVSYLRDVNVLLLSQLSVTRHFKFGHSSFNGPLPWVWEEVRPVTKEIVFYESIYKVEK